ncbi:DUF4832 domain-containing protein, partial [Chamaesiphon sp. VAR_48_metabat_403]|uniref:DUF4832 domain-containing protein n=1 Tax=Chamaesiphon sp. VAR_48_metabat_403 TaxID=2964700 RepID=UPI00286E224B
ISMLLFGCTSKVDEPTKIARASIAPREVHPTPDLSLTATKPASAGSIVTYVPTTAEFLNPERGFHNDIELIKGRDFSDVRQKGYTLSRAYIRLDEYRNTPLPAEFLAQLNRQFQLVRAAGIKAIPRFSYNFPTGNIANSPDASLELTLEHIAQLKPVLQQNADVIAVLQGGFIGAWGEWHSSGSKLDRPQPKAKILSALLTAMPANRMVQIRYANDIKTFYPQSLRSADAFSGSRQARVGFKNDCFLAGRTDAGTYEPDVPTLKNYISKIAPYVVVGGETCQVRPAEHRSDCPTAEAELAQFHWSYLNANFYEPALNRWKSEGCYARIDRSLGYRLQLVKSNFPSQVRQNRQLSGNFVIKNVGYASPFNPRNLELILRHQQTGKVYRLPLLKPGSKTYDPRLWLPEAGAISVDIRSKIPSAAPLGVYDILLNLPDPIAKLANRPEYSIRLANERTWEAKTGFNSLRRTMRLAK